MDRKEYWTFESHLSLVVDIIYQMYIIVMSEGNLCLMADAEMQALYFNSCIEWSCPVKNFPPFLINNLRCHPLHPPLPHRAPTRSTSSSMVLISSLPLIYRLCFSESRSQHSTSLSIARVIPHTPKAHSVLLTPFKSLFLSLKAYPSGLWLSLTFLTVAFYILYSAYICCT